MGVFISHSQKDEAAYSGFCLALDGKHIDRWDPESMAIGQSLADQLREAIRICDTCVFLATKRSVESKWCMAELGAFWGAGNMSLSFSLILRSVRRNYQPNSRVICELGMHAKF